MRKKDRGEEEWTRIRSLLKPGDVTCRKPGINENTNGCAWILLILSGDFPISNNSQNTYRYLISRSRAGENVAFIHWQLSLFYEKSSTINNLPQKNKRSHQAEHTDRNTSTHSSHSAPKTFIRARRSRSCRGLEIWTKILGTTFTPRHTLERFALNVHYCD